MTDAHFPAISDEYYNDKTFFEVNSLRSFPYFYLAKEDLGYITYI